ncbi:MAG: hypothetical protein RBT47_12245, partial [Anaerolineae bacterium]|nr:hypothetical protein [Anaerolineae bacterium]
MEKVLATSESNRTRLIGLIVAFVLVTAILPYLLVWAATPEGYHYMWNSYNPPDADTYLAKMRLGWFGEWQFKLLHTPERQTGTYLNLFYLALGHGARWLNLSLPAVFHGARIVSALVLLYALWWLSGLVTSSSSARVWGVWFALAGGGVGWAALWLRPLPVDLSVPESYGFLSILVNPHFPAAQALLIVVLGGLVRWLHDRDAALGIWPVVLALGLVALGVIQPFAVATVGLAWGLWLMGWLFGQHRIRWQTLAVLVLIGSIGLLYPLYGVMVIRQDPILSAWNAQNLTPSPPWWSWVLGYAVVLPFMVVGLDRLRKQDHPLGWMLLAWIVVTLIGIASPLGIQRRFSLGLSIPVGMLAGVGWEQVLSRCSSWRIGLRGAMIVLTLATPLVMILVGTRQPQYADLFYISDREVAAARSLLALGPDHVILSSPVRGEALPWLSGQRVVVGHPMETVAY